MRLLFTLDKHDYNTCERAFIRPSSRAIIIADHKITLVHSIKYDYYKFPGGGIEQGEQPIQALVRETREEAGLQIIEDSVREYGCVHRIQKSTHEGEDVFIQDNYYYLCAVSEQAVSQSLCAYELEENFTLEYVHPQIAINANLTVDHGPKNKTMIEREAKVLQMLIDEGYFD